MLTSTLDFMWPMHQQSLMLLHPMVKEKMHLKENTLFDLDLGVNVTQNVAQYPWHHVTYAPTKFDIATSHGWGEDAFTRNTLNDLDLQVKVTWNVSQCPLHHVTYAPTEFKVTMSKALGGEAFTRKFNIWPLTLTLGSSSHKMLPSTLYIMWPIHLQSFKLLRLTL